MSTWRELIEDPNYAEAATASSKTSLFFFIATFTYLAFFAASSPGIVGGAAFFVIGTFAVPLLITMPLFLLFGTRFQHASLFSIVNIAVTILLTRATFSWLFIPGL